MIYVLSGSQKAFAVIGVTYPAGSTCTCSDGTKTLRLKDTSGQGFFLIPYVATWTVTATDGTNTKSESVEITSEGQSVRVEIIYQFMLFDNGIVNGITWNAQTKPSLAISDVSSVIEVGGSTYDDGVSMIYPTGWRGTTNAVDLSKYSVLKVTVSETSGSGGVSLGIGSKAVSKDILSGSISKDAGSTTSFDISSLNDSRFISIYAGPNVFNTFRAKINKVWME